MPYVVSAQQKAFEQRIQSWMECGRQQERREVVSSILMNRFGGVDEDLSKAMDLLVQMPPSELTPLLLTLSREELIVRFAPQP
jgi:hypothetical protein